MNEQKNQLLIDIDNIKKEISVIGLPKNKQNKGQMYKFRGIDDVYNLLCPLLAKYHVTIIPENTTIINTSERKNTNGALMRFVIIQVQYKISSPYYSESLQATTLGEAMDTSDKAINKAMSSAYKYLCFQLFAIPTQSSKDIENDNNELQAPTLDTVSLKNINQCKTIDELTDLFNALKDIEDIEELTRACGIRKKQIYKLEQLKKI